MIQFQPEFCERVLPLLVHDILIEGTNVHKDVISRHISNFFLLHCTHTEGSASTTPLMTGNIQSIIKTHNDVQINLKLILYMIL